MRKIYTYITFLVVVLGYSQEQLPTDLSVAVKESEVWKRKFSTPDFSYYNKNFDKVFEGSEYTFDMLNRSRDMVYVEGDKFYSNTYVPIFLQQQFSSLSVQNYYNPDKTYSVPDPRDIPIK